MPNHLYRVTITNLPFKQAQGLYRLLVDLGDDEILTGSAGKSWSGGILRLGSHTKGCGITIRPEKSEDKFQIGDKVWVYPDGEYEPSLGVITEVNDGDQGDFEYYVEDPVTKRGSFWPRENLAIRQ